MTVNVFATGLARDLLERKENGNPIRIGLVGSGEMGTDIVTRASMMEGLMLPQSPTSIRHGHIRLSPLHMVPRATALTLLRAMPSTPS